MKSTACSAGASSETHCHLMMGGLLLLSFRKEKQCYQFEQLCSLIKQQFSQGPRGQGGGDTVRYRSVVKGKHAWGLALVAEDTDLPDFPWLREKMVHVSGTASVRAERNRTNQECEVSSYSHRQSQRSPSGSAWSIPSANQSIGNSTIQNLSKLSYSPLNAPHIS